MIAVGYLKDRGRTEPAHKSIKPRLSAIITACVRSAARSFERMLLTWFLTVCSEMLSSEAIPPFELPRATPRRTSISLVVRASSIECSASSLAISGGIRLFPA